MQVQCSAVDVMAASLCQTGHISGEELEWEALMQFEHVDWNDIIDAEMSGNSDALLLLKLVAI